MNLEGEHDLGDPSVHARWIASHALHRLESPACRLVTDGRFSGDSELPAARVAPLAFGAPGPFLEEKGVGYPRSPWKPRESLGASARSLGATAMPVGGP